MPYRNERSCRLKDPALFQSESFRRIEQGRLSIIIGRLKGHVETTAQAYRYLIDQWSEDQARGHCEKEGGSFHPAQPAEALLEAVKVELAKRSSYTQSSLPTPDPAN